MRADLQAPVKFIRGVGPYRAKLLEKLGIKTLEDATFTIPRTYEDRRLTGPLSQAEAGERITVTGEITATEIKTTAKKGMKIYHAVISDGTGQLMIKWFRLHRKYFQENFQKGRRVLVSGIAEQDWFKGGALSLTHPEHRFIEDSEERAGGFLPIYPGTAGLSQTAIQEIIHQAVNICLHQLTDPLPEEIRKRYGFPDLTESLRAVHFPDKNADLESLRNWSTPAHCRLAYEEFFLLELGINYKKKREDDRSPGIAFTVNHSIARNLRLPFHLTQSQNRVLREILDDMASPVSMYRLRPGDVGSGKTVVALLAALTAVENGCQVSIMVPTEILASQHCRSIRQFLDQAGLNHSLLVGGQKTKAKREVLEKIASGETQVVIGTHAVIQKTVKFARLGLIIIDEQHRFGVLQRAMIHEKGQQPDLLVMTATPIPRSLALTVYGDLSLSVINELPPGRRPVITKLILESHRAQLLRFMKSEMDKGGKVFLVCPLVEESETQDLQNATDTWKKMEELFPGHQVGLIHGRLKREEKEEVMKRLRSGELDMVVATTVIEVGIDIPEATVMLIEHAERFGLAQMHQLRGRIGRGERESYCFLGAYQPISEAARTRLKAMVKYSDGFKLAEVDLQLRGPGDFLGTRQAGLPNFRIANILRDIRWLELARADARATLRTDPGLKQPGHQDLKKDLLLRWAEKLRLYNFG
ncbi:MAG: ATP-dependent DNA helicase RecG [bacterium]